MYYDIFSLLIKGEILIGTNSRFGFLEFFKHAPRVGYRYLSIALVQTLFAGLVMAFYYRHQKSALQHLGYFILGLSLFSLALIDTRAAYVSIFIGLALLGIGLGFKKCGILFNSIIHHSSRRTGLIVMSALMIFTTIAFSSGKSRWATMNYSVGAAIHDFFDETSPVSIKPYVDIAFWNNEILDLTKCYVEKQKRCMLDQSSYLRVAWLLTGLESIKNNPLGIGYSNEDIGHIWNVIGQREKWKHIDNFFIRNIILFGIPVVILFSYMLFEILNSIRQIDVNNKKDAIYLLLGLLILICIGRSLIDVFSEGLWRYFMLLLGLYYGKYLKNK